MSAETPRDLLAETLDAGIREWEDHGGPLLPILHRHVHPALDALVAERVAALAEDEALTRRAQAIWWDQGAEGGWSPLIRALAAALTERRPS